MRMTAEEEQKIIDYNMAHSQEIQQEIIDDLQRNIKSLRKLCCKLGIHSWTSFLIAPYTCLPEMCRYCGKIK